MAPALARCRLVSSDTSAEWCALLAGRPGNGKTHLAIAAMQEYGLHRAYYWKTPDFLDWIRSRTIDDGFPIETVLRSYRDSDFLLVLDDYGVENTTEWAFEQLWRVLDSRCEGHLPTIITTNQQPGELSERLLSRFRAGLVLCRGRDVRSYYDGDGR